VAGGEAHGERDAQGSRPSCDRLAAVSVDLAGRRTGTDEAGMLSEW
jgi:hypothetical protein